MKCFWQACKSDAAGVWRPVLRFYAPRPLNGSFTSEMGISFCPACKAAVTLTDLLTPELTEIVMAGVQRMGKMTPDITRTQLEWMPVAEAHALEEPRPAGPGGPVDRHIFVSDDADEIADARKSYGDKLETIASACINFGPLAEKWSSVKEPPAYRCAACEGAFKHPIVGGGRSRRCNFQNRRRARLGDAAARAVLCGAKG